MGVGGEGQCRGYPRRGAAARAPDIRPARVAGPRSPISVNLEGQPVPVALEQVPGVGVQLVLDALDHSGRAEQANRPLAAEGEAQEVVKAGPVVHVGVRDEDVGHPQELAGRQGGEIAGVDEEGAAAVHQIDEQGRVAEGAVHEVRVEGAGQGMGSGGACNTSRHSGEARGA